MIIKPLTIVATLLYMGLTIGSWLPVLMRML